MKRVFLVASLLLLSGLARAHTAVTGVVPAAHASVTAPKNVEIKFNEPVDLHFATFKVYALHVQADKLALNRAAATLAKKVLKAKDDARQRADLFVPSSETSNHVVVPLKTNLPNGSYVLMWRVLSADGHIVTGQSVFLIR